MFSDIHVHHRSKDTTSAKSLLKKMDKQGMKRMAVLAPYFSEKGIHTGAMTTDELQKQSTDVVAKFCSADPQRLVAFAWIEPCLPRAVLAVQYAIETRRVKGIKMIPNHWYPYEERILPVYAQIEAYKKPILFHSGILWGFGDSSRFCRPAGYEVLLHFPKIKFALAHISWPWTDECIAVAGRMRYAVNREKGRSMQMYIDLTPGTPAIYRKDALYKAVSYVGADNLIFGSDSITTNISHTKKQYENDRKLVVDELGFKSSDFEKIAWKNFDEFLKPMN